MIINGWGEYGITNPYFVVNGHIVNNVNGQSSYRREYFGFNLAVFKTSVLYIHHEIGQMQAYVHLWRRNIGKGNIFVEHYPFNGFLPADTVSLCLRINKKLIPFVIKIMKLIYNLLCKKFTSGPCNNT